MIIVLRFLRKTRFEEVGEHRLGLHTVSLTCVRRTADQGPCAICEKSDIEYGCNELGTDRVCMLKMR